jgi:hypothetical protein
MRTLRGVRSLEDLDRSDPALGGPHLLLDGLGDTGCQGNAFRGSPVLFGEQSSVRRTPA